MSVQQLIERVLGKAQADPEDPNEPYRRKHDAWIANLRRLRSAEAALKARRKELDTRLSEAAAHVGIAGELPPPELLAELGKALLEDLTLLRLLVDVEHEAERQSVRHVPASKPWPPQVIRQESAGGGGF